MAWDCDSIEWLVDILGTLDLLASAGDCDAYDVSVRGPARSNFRGSKPPDGLYFDGAHWYSVKGFLKQDSYTAQYQVKGTAHFCQTFALMIYLGKDSSLKVGDYAENVRKALQFWIDFFTTNPDHGKWICKNIKASKWKDVVPESQTTTLASITPTRWMNFLVAVQNQASNFYACKQG